MKVWLTAALLCIPVTASVQEGATAPSLETLLARPVTPGNLVLLLPYSAAPDVQARWRAAAEAASPALRAAAARVIFVSGYLHLLPAVRRALDGESDQDAALEQARALAALGDAHGVQAAAAAARRVGGGALFAVANAVAVTQPLELVGDSWLADPPDVYGAALARAASHAVGAPSAERLAAAALRSGTLAWLAFLGGMHAERVDAPTNALAAALDHADAAVVRATIWHLALVGNDATANAPVVRTAFDRAVERLGATKAPEGFVRELFNRSPRPGAAPGRDWATLIAAWGRSETGELPSMGTLGQRATRAEQKAIARLLEKKEWPARSPAAPKNPGGVTSTDDPLVHTTTAYPRGLVTDTLAAAGCRAPADAFAGAEVVYRPDGRPQRLVGLESHLGEPCRSAIVALMLASVGRPGTAAAAARTHLVMIGLGGDRLACADTEPPDSGLLRQYPLFRNRRGDRLKILAWDHGGFWVLYYKRLERGTFAWPTEDRGESVTMGSGDLGLLLAGIDLAHTRPRRWYERAA